MSKKNRQTTEEMPDSAPVAQPNPRRDPRESFVRLAERRTNRALKDLRALIPLANRAAYSYSTEEGEAIVAALAGAIADVKRAFEGHKQERPLFRLDAALASENGSNGDTAQR